MAEVEIELEEMDEEEAELVVIELLHDNQETESEGDVISLQVKVEDNYNDGTEDLKNADNVSGDEEFEEGIIIMDEEGNYCFQRDVVAGPVTSQLPSTSARIVQAIPENTLLSKGKLNNTSNIKNFKNTPKSNQSVRIRSDLRSSGDTSASEAVGINSEKVYDFYEKHCFDKPEECDSWDEYSGDHNYLTVNTETNAQEKPFMCCICKKTFKYKTSATDHINIHLGHKPYKCTHCEKHFRSTAQVARHRLHHHTEQKPHKCTICDYSCVRRDKLKSHMRKHTGELPYKCAFCPHAARDVDSLRRHMNIHTGQYECEICHARFTLNSSLKYHRDTHLTNDRPEFQCSRCPAKYKRKSDLGVHIKKYHNTDNPKSCKLCKQILHDNYSYKIHMRDHKICGKRNKRLNPDCEQTLGHSDNELHYREAHEVDVKTQQKLDLLTQDSQPSIIEKAVIIASKRIKIEIPEPYNEVINCDESKQYVCVGNEGTGVSSVSNESISNVIVKQEAINESNIDPFADNSIDIKQEPDCDEFLSIKTEDG